MSSSDKTQGDQKDGNLQENRKDKLSEDDKADKLENSIE